jgi:hypothetical protein
MIGVPDLIRSRASRRAVSGSPTSSRATMPFSMSASISNRMSLHADERDGACAGEPHLAHPPQMLDREIT